MDLNKVTLIGRLTRDPESRTVPSGQSLASFSIATNYIWKDMKSKQKKDKTEFHRVVVWGSLADITKKYLRKASRVYIEGRLQYHDWTDKKGAKRFNADIVADEIIMLGHNGRSVTGEGEFVKEAPNSKELVIEEV